MNPILCPVLILFTGLFAVYLGALANPLTFEAVSVSSESEAYLSTSSNKGVNVDEELTKSSSSEGSIIEITDRDKGTTTFLKATSTSTHPDKKDVETTTPFSPSSSVTKTHTLPTPQPLRNMTGTIPLRGKCNTTEQCKGEFTECRLSMCKCELGYLPLPTNAELCGLASNHHVQVPQTDPTMIGVVIGLVLMSITLCVVMRLFAKARFQENRTIFNTPNPRLMNVSLLKGSKTLLRNSSGGQRSRRGSQVSINSVGNEGKEEQKPGNAPSGSGPGPNKPSRSRPQRQPSSDTPNLEAAPAAQPSSSRPASSVNKAKFRQDSVASNSNV